MARSLIRAAPIYLNGKKIAEVSDGSYDITSGDESHIATEGYLGHSDGATTVKINANCIIPVKGTGVALDDLILNKRYFSIGLPVNGKFHQIDCRMVTANYKWDFKTGSLTGAFAMEGGSPDLVG